MSDTQNTHDFPKSRHPSRRRFLLGAGATATAIGGGAYLLGGSAERWPDAVAPSSSESPSGAPKKPLTPVPEGRTLVVIDLNGGNDGLATLEPYGSGRLRSLRENMMHDPEDLVVLDDEMGLNPSLAGLHQQGLAVIEGVGLTDGGLSHFEMENRWAYGMTSSADDYSTGFLGRLCDELDVGAPLTGLAIGGSGYSRALLANKAVTAGLRNAEAGWYFRSEDAWYQQYRRSVLAMGNGSASETAGNSALTASARLGAAQAVEFADMLGGLVPDGDEAAEAAEQERRETYPGTELGQKLAATASLLRADAGLRVVQVSHGGFDTHDDQPGSHDYLMMELNDALVAFRNDLANTDLDRSTLIATTSEFGRRPRSSGSGTDHGNASVAMLAGPIVAGRHGESPSLTKLDNEDNLSPTVGMSDYYATLASWFGVDASNVLSGNATPIEGVIA